MALAAKNEGLKRVPWLSLGEWRRVYEDVYSNDTALQTRGYETLLVWKGRMSKLPVGVDCTLSLLQVCLRDRELSPLLNLGSVPLYYENDLCLMYSTVIMRFLNQISNVGHTKQTSLFQIAKQLNIPEWIVNLRHDAAHGHELPSLSLLRMAANILLAWLHDEYWRAEAVALESFISTEENKNTDSTDGLLDLIELWVSVGLYIAADFVLVTDLPDENLKGTLLDLFALQKSKKQDLNSSLDNVEVAYRLTAARSHLFSEISTEIRQKNIEPEVLTDFLANNEAFFPSAEILELFSRDSGGNIGNFPRKFVAYWQPLISILLEVEILEALVVKLVEVAGSEKEKVNKRRQAAMWLRIIGQGLVRLKIAQKEGTAFEVSQKKIRKTPQKVFNQKVQERVDKKRPDLKNSIWFPVSSEIPHCFTTDEFASDVIINADEFTSIFAEYFLDLINPEIDAERKNVVVELLKIQSTEILDDDDEKNDAIYTVDDLKVACGQENEVEMREMPEDKKTEEKQLFDKKIRNSTWELAPVDFDWAHAPFGVLPWQIENLETIQVEGGVPKVVRGSGEADIVPGYVDKEKVLKGTRVNWDKVLRKSLRGKRKKDRAADVVMDRAIRVAKTRRV